MTGISLANILETCSVDGLRVGDSLTQLAGSLYPPDGWDFPYEGTTSGYLTYGPLEIFLHTADDTVSVYLIQLHLMKRVRRTIRVKKRVGEDIVFVRPPFKEITITAIEKFLTTNKISFTRNDQEDIDTGAYPYFEVAGKVRLYFSQRSGKYLMNLIEFADYLGSRSSAN